MKKCLPLAAALLMVSYLAFSQGRIAFTTFNFAPVTNSITGQLIPMGSNWWAQLYYGPPGSDESQLVSVTNAPVHFTIPGYILSASPYYTDPAIVSGGAFGIFQVRAWAAILGNTWEEAYLNWTIGPSHPDRLLGRSNLALIKTGDATAIPIPNPPAGLRGNGPGEIGLRPFGVGSIPEPVVLSLLIVAVPVLLSFRRGQ